MTVDKRSLSLANFTRITPANEELPSARLTAFADSAARCARATIPVMMRRGGGAIVIVASVWGVVAGPAVAAYAAAKGGLINLIRTMAIDHGPDGIRVNAICPGGIDTPLMREEMQLVGDGPDTTIPASAQARPIRRIGQPQDAAAAIEFLASDDAGYITGSTLIMDGGWHAGG